MSEPSEIPDDVAACRALIQTQAATIASQDKKIEELSLEMEKLRKLLSHFINGQRSEKRIITGPNQDWLPFETQEEFQAARAEAEAQAEAVIQTYTVEREVQNKKPRNESLPSHLRREEQIIAGDAMQKTCSTHGERTIIGYDTTETLVHKRPELYVLVKKYPKYACPGNPECGIASPERPTSLVEGDRYDTSVAATIVEAKWFHHMPMYRQQDQFAGSGWTPRRSTLSNIVSQVDFVASPLVEFMTKLVQQDIGVGIDDTTCRMLLPNTIPAATPGDAKSRRLAEKIAEARTRETTACWPRCGSTRACTRRLTTSSTFASHGIAMAPTISSVKAAAGCKEIASRETGAWCFTATTAWSSWRAGVTRAARSWRQPPTGPSASCSWP